MHFQIEKRSYPVASGNRRRYDGSDSTGGCKSYDASIRLQLIGRDGNDVGWHGNVLDSTPRPLNSQ